MPRTDQIMRSVGIAVVTGAVMFSTLPCAAIAEGVGAAPEGTSQTSEPPSGGAPGGIAPDGGAPDAGGMGTGGAPGGGGGGADTMTFDYAGSYSGTLTADGEAASADGQTIESTVSDQNAALVTNGGTLSLTDALLSKSGDDSNSDNSNFYGVNSILLAVGEGSTATVSGTTLSAASEGSNAIFSTDSATVLANDVTIQTASDNSRGLDATYAGTILAAGADISTQGDHSASVATDRGGGTISVVDSTLSTAGSGSPLLYSTGNVQASNVSGTATGSQIAGMEGLNTILINSSTLESTITEKTASDPVANGVIIYQSTSGDAEATTGDAATFQAADSTLSSEIASGSMFYLTNTTADIVLKGTELDFDSRAANLLLAAGNDANNWGSAGSNGATVRFTAIEQELEGTIEADTISSVDVHLTDSSTWTGTARISENVSGSSSEAPLAVNVDATSTWVVTESCTVSALHVAEGGQVVDEQGRTVSIVANGETVVAGDSDLTVSVTGDYSATYDASSAGALSADLIDRSAFDEEFGTDTTWSMGDSAAKVASGTATGADSTQTAAQDATPTADGTNPIVAFFSAVAAWFSELFGA